MIDLKHRILFIHIPRTGGTSIARWFRDLGPAGGVPRVPRPGWGPHCSLGMYEDVFFDGAIPDDFRIFTIVRHPETRFWSEWASRSLPRAGSAPLHATMPAAVLMHLARHPHPRLAALDRHLRPQTTYLDGRAAGRVRVLRQETLAADFARLCAAWGLPNRPLGRHNASPGRPAPGYGLTRRVERFVADFYARDFHALGYQPPSTDGAAPTWRDASAALPGGGRALR